MYFFVNIAKFLRNYFFIEPLRGCFCSNLTTEVSAIANKQSQIVFTILVYLKNFHFFVLNISLILNKCNSFDDKKQ